MTQQISSISRTVVRMFARRDYPDGSSHHKRAAMTGFLWNENEQVYLITNWHNLTGLNPESLSPNGSFFPSVIELNFFIQLDQENGQDLISYRSREFPLFSDDCTAMWIEHKRRHKVDIVAMPLCSEILGDGILYCLNKVDFLASWKPDVGADCFIVGFPENLAGPINTPIWKRGSISTEPNAATKSEPVILIDTLGNEWLSGSPVIAQASGIFSSNRRALSTDSVIGTWRNFLGVYSGRTSTEGVGFQLGRVWRASLLDDIIANGVTGYHPKLQD